MNRSKQIAAIAESEDEKMCLIRVCDRMERAQEREMPAASAFLSPREQALVQQLLPKIQFWGGTEGAERKIAYYLPEYMEKEDYFTDGPIGCLRGDFYEANSLGHRDVLGALMGAGLRRDAIGDIFVHEKHCEFFLLADLTDYLMENLTGAGRQHLQLQKVDPATVEKPPQSMKTLRVTVSSMRLDGVLSAAFHLSRGKAVEAVNGGRVNVNALTCMKPDRMVRPLDEISLRGVGKLRILEEHGQTKKDRTAVTVGIYL